MPSNLVIGDGSSLGNSGEVPRLRAHYEDEDQWENSTAGGVSEIEEESPASAAVGSQVFRITDSDRFKIPLASIKEEVAVRGRLPAASFDFGERGEDVVYVAVGKQGGVDDQTSMGAVIWAIKDAAINPSSVVFLVHVFPETKYIPTPLGNLPISRVNPEQKEVYMATERSKRRDFLQKFLNVCSASKVKADTILIESEMEAKAILDLIPILNIRKLILGATNSTVRRMRYRKGTGVAHQILKSAPDFCEVKIICEGKEMCELMTGSTSPHSSSSSPSPSPRRTTDHSTPRFGQRQEQEQTRFDSTSCGCFRL
ncbi:hypothetical protein OROMI_023538 [Orobanche minor]